MATPFDYDFNILVGDCGSGKSSLLVNFVQDYVLRRGDERLELCEQLVRAINAERKKPIPFPEQLPIYTNLDFTVKDKRGRTIKPIPIRGADIGINEPGENKYKWLYPASLLVFDEAHAELPNDSLPPAQLNFFNKRRHNRLMIVFATPRAYNVRKDLRTTGAHFIEVLRCEHKKSTFHKVIESEWHCREFSDKGNLEKYIASDGAEGEYAATTYIHKGDIFSKYNSYAFAKDFTPPPGECFFRG